MTLLPLRLDVSPLDMSPMPLDLTLVKQHLGVSGDDFDALIAMYAAAAVAWAEGQMHRSIFARQHIWTLREFPVCGDQGIRLPRGKTQSVESVVYLQNGEPVTLTGPSGSPAGTGYREDLRGDDGGCILPLYGGSWPSVDCEAPAPVTIKFTAGYLPAEVPADIVHALLFSISDAFDTRGSADMTMFNKGFGARNSLVSPYRLNRWY